MLVPVRGEISREKARFSSDSIIAELGIENCSIHNELVEYASEVGNELPIMRLGRVDGQYAKGIDCLRPPQQNSNGQEITNDLGWESTQAAINIEHCEEMAEVSALS